MTKPVPRGTFRRSCRTCGWSGTFHTQGIANWAKQQHSCQRWLDRAAAHQRGLDRMAAVDRTPKPCPHGGIHEHGVYVTYVHDGCRCPACANGKLEYERHRKRQQAYGRWNGLVDAEPTRQHVRSLMSRSMGLKRVGEAAGVSHGTLAKLIYGRTRDDGSIRPPSRRIQPAIADKLLAVELDLADGAYVGPDVVAGVALRMRALVALGWSQAKLADRVNIRRSNFHLTEHRWSMTAGHARAAIALYEELSMRLPPEQDRYDRIAATKARRHAAERGWLPPLALDDDRLDDPDYIPHQELLAENEPDLDEQAIYRRMHGDKAVRLTKAEKAELRRRWVASGRPLNEMERVTGLNSGRHRDDLEEAS